MSGERIGGGVRRVGRVVEITSLAHFDQLVERGARRMEGWRLFDVDLHERTTTLLRLDPAGALLLGCAISGPALDHLQRGGAVVFPDVPDVPLDAYRQGLYAPAELFGRLADGDGDYAGSLDARIYAWSQRPGGPPENAVARALHDAAIENALDRSIHGQRLVGVMGGHALVRGDAGYLAAAELGRRLTRSGFVVATGGGPGAMEAANLGAYLAAAADDALPAAVAALAAVPSFRPSVRDWAAAAFEVRRRWPGGDGGVGVPTWFYGHEPPNAFADRIAKLVQNSVREATLLARCNAGIVFLPGAAGTVQEIFQDACENYYAETPLIAPMVLVGERHWTEDLPAWPLLRALAAERPMARQVALVEDPLDALAHLTIEG
ncbi:MAG: LOG family protein [Desertimonas sp.]